MRSLRHAVTCCPSGSPVCDPFLGLTKGCECRGKKTVEKVTVKPLVSRSTHTTSLHV